MGKGNKSKKAQRNTSLKTTDNETRNTEPPVNQTSSHQQLDISDPAKDESMVNQTSRSGRQAQESMSEETVCEICKQNKPATWLVECSDCGRWFHYECVQFNSEEILDEDPWYCDECYCKRMVEEDSNDNTSQIVKINTRTNRSDEIGESSSVTRPSHGASRLEMIHIEDETELNSPAFSSIDQLLQNQRSSFGSLSQLMQSQQSSYPMASIHNILQEFTSHYPTEQRQSSRLDDQSIVANRIVREIVETQRLKEALVRTRKSISAKQPDPSKLESVKVIKSATISVNNVNNQSIPADFASRHSIPTSVVTRQSILDAVNSQSIPIIDENNDKDTAQKLRENSFVRATSQTCGSTNTTLSSQSRARLEKQRLQEELDVQTQIDEERIALKMEALLLKENREKKFLVDKFKAMNDDDGLSDDGTSKKSKKSTHSKQLDKTEEVLAWIEDQRRQKSKQIQQTEKTAPPNLEMSIAVSEREMRDILDKQQKVQDDEQDRQWSKRPADQDQLNAVPDQAVSYSNQRNVKFNSTWIQDEHKPTPEFNQPDVETPPSYNQDYNRMDQTYIQHQQHPGFMSAQRPVNIPVSQSHQHASSSYQRNQGPTNPPLIQPYQHTYSSYQQNQTPINQQSKFNNQLLTSYALADCANQTCEYCTFMNIMS